MEYLPSDVAGLPRTDHRGTGDHRVRARIYKLFADKKKIPRRSPENASGDKIQTRDVRSISMGDIYTDTYYKLTFFAFTEDRDKDVLTPSFEYPLHFDTIEDAEIAAKYWMSKGFFDACRCDRYNDPLLQFSGTIESGKFIIVKREI
jgi:hypothetical protein